MKDVGSRVKGVGSKESGRRMAPIGGFSARMSGSTPAFRIQSGGCRVESSVFRV